jgi:hypothetical protein
MLDWNPIDENSLNCVCVFRFTTDTPFYPALALPDLGQILLSSCRRRVGRPPGFLNPDSHRQSSSAFMTGVFITDPRIFHSIRPWNCSLRLRTRASLWLCIQWRQNPFPTLRYTWINTMKPTKDKGLILPINVLRTQENPNAVQEWDVDLYKVDSLGRGYAMVSPRHCCSRQRLYPVGVGEDWSHFGFVGKSGKN